MKPGRLIYFNNASTSWPKPREVLEEVTRSLRQPYQSRGRVSVKGLLDYPSATRELLCEFFKADEPGNFQFTANATDSLNTLIHGFAMRQKGGFHAITTELEHNSVLRPLNTLESMGRLKLTIVPFDDSGYVRLDSIRDALTDETKLVVMTHGSNVLGTVQDIRGIGSYLKKQGVYFIVDGAQTAGHVKTELSKLPVDAFAFTGHKALYGFQGIGGFYLKDPASVDPFRQGGTGSHSKMPLQPDFMPLKFEAGTPNYPGIASLSAGVRFLKRIGLERIEKKTKSMNGRIIRRLCEESDITVYNKQPDLPLVSFNIQELANDDVEMILSESYGIIARSGDHCAPLLHVRIDGGAGCVRLSLSYFNTMEECETVSDAISSLAKSARKYVR
ncbi:MAG: aminotransferase class V-fold PLP-dependent enzyme [Candidatus Altiarchaeota archaeon]